MLGMILPAERCHIILSLHLPNDPVPSFTQCPIGHNDNPVQLQCLTDKGEATPLSPVKGRVWTLSLQQSYHPSYLDKQNVIIIAFIL